MFSASEFARLFTLGGAGDALGAAEIAVSPVTAVHKAAQRS